MKETDYGTEATNWRRVARKYDKLRDVSQRTYHHLWVFWQPGNSMAKACFRKKVTC